MGRDFVHQTAPVRTVFARGSRATLPAEVDQLGLRRLLVVTGARRRPAIDELTDALGDRVVDRRPDARMHVPRADAEQAAAIATEVAADGVVAVGGGSPIGLGKAIARRTGLPLVAVPTTFSGSEMTPVWGETDDDGKTTGRDERVRPRLVLYDADLAAGMPPDLVATSGVNALAHAAEALYAPDVSPVVELMAGESARTLGAVLRRIAQADGPPDTERETDEMLYGAWLAGTCLGSTTMSLHHQLAHVLGGTLGLPHSSTHTVLLPHVLAYNLPAAPRARAVLAEAFGHEDPASRLLELVERLDVPHTLKELGMPEDAIEPVVARVLAGSYANPRALDADAVRAVVRGAWSGIAVAGGAGR